MRMKEYNPQDKMNVDPKEVEDLKEALKASEDTKEQEAVKEQVLEMQAKQSEKEAKKAKKYWNTMITRKEAYELVSEALTPEHNKLSMMYIQLKTITDLLLDKDIVTKEELEKKSEAVLKEIYGNAEDIQEEDKEEEKEE